MVRAVCPFCFREIDSQRLAYQCTGRGDVACKKAEDEARIRITGSHQETFPTFMPTTRMGDSVSCPICGGPARRRACPQCHTALPIDFVGSKSPLIGLLGAKGSGKTVLMTVLVRQLREVVGRRFDADIRIATENPDGYQGLSDYRSSREAPLYENRALPVGTLPLGVTWPLRTTPVVLRWRQESRGLFGHGLRSTTLSFVDTAGEDLNDLDTAFILAYVSVCDGLIITLDPFALPGARARLDLPEAAIQVDAEVPLDVLSRITELIRTERKVKSGKRINTPVAIAVTKMDAFYPLLDRNNPIMATPRAMPFYDNIDGQAVHEHVLGLLHEWGAEDIDRHLQLNYANFRYFGISALGAEPDYRTAMLAPGGVQPHRVEDPVLWLMSKFGTVASALPDIPFSLHAWGHRKLVAVAETDGRLRNSLDVVAVAMVCSG